MAPAGVTRLRAGLLKSNTLRPAARRPKPLTRLLRYATALRVTAPLGCGSDSWYGRKVPFGASAAPTIFSSNEDGGWGFLSRWGSFRLFDFEFWEGENRRRESRSDFQGRWETNGNLVSFIMPSSCCSARRVRGTETGKQLLLGSPSRPTARAPCPFWPSGNFSKDSASGSSLWRVWKFGSALDAPRVERPQGANSALECRGREPLLRRGAIRKGNCSTR